MEQQLPDERTLHAEVNSSQRVEEKHVKSLKALGSKLTVTFTSVLLAKASHVVKLHINGVSIYLPYRSNEGNKYL